MPMKLQPQCVVPPSLALALRVSRMVGIAPLKFIAKKNEFIIRMSTGLCVYSYLLVTALNVCTLISVISDSSVSPELTVRMKTGTKKFVWIADVIIVGILSGVGVYTAPIQMRRLIAYINRIEKINFDLLTYDSSKSDKFLYRLTLGTLLFTFFIMLVDFATVTYYAEVEKRHMGVASMYICYYCSYFIAHLLEMQFVIIAALVLSSLKLLNTGLKKLLRDSGIESLPELSNDSTINVVNPPEEMPKKSVNNTIDALAFDWKNRSNRLPATKWTDQRTIRRLALSYGSICEVVRQIDDNNGIIVILLLASYLLHLVVTPYYLIISFGMLLTFMTAWYLLQFVTESTHLGYQKYLNPTLQTTWCVYHTFCLVMIIEPCHRTHEEMELTRELVGRLMCCADSLDPAAVDLEMFFRQLVLNKVSYAPMKVWTLTRSLVATVMGFYSYIRQMRSRLTMILGSITTYLIVIVQLEVKNVQ